MGILVFSADPSETLQSRGGHIVLKRCYQLFINILLNSSWGQLKEKLYFVKKCIISLGVNNV
jgi:hypothetical protein